MTVTLSRWPKAPFIFVNGDLVEEVVDAVDDALRYEVQDAEYTDSWQSGDWDGTIGLLYEKRDDGTLYFPVGCLQIVREIFDAFAVDYELENVRLPGRGEMDFSWDTDKTLRDYQQDALDTALEIGCGLIVMPTGAGKTLLGLRMAKKLQQPFIVTVHMTEIADQWVDAIEEYLGVEPARYYGGDREEGPVMVALYQSLYEDGQVRSDVSLDHTVLLADEAHNVAADTFSSVTMEVNADYRFGFTATNEREDNKDLEITAGTGPVISDISPEALIDQGYLAEPRWRIIKVPPKGGSYEHWQSEYKQEIVRNEVRNEMIEVEVDDLPKPCLVTVERINHGERLVERIDGAEFVYGDASDREENIQAFRDGDLDVMIASRGIVGEGFNVPEIESFVVAGGLKSEISMIQQVGRALRPETDYATIVDFLDRGRYIGDHSSSRLDTYRDYYGQQYGPSKGDVK